jgi:hypothetical protein
MRPGGKNASKSVKSAFGEGPRTLKNANAPLLTRRNNLKPHNL